MHQPEPDPASDAGSILRRHFIRGNPAREASLRAERLRAGLAQEVHDFRAERGLTREQLAALAGTTESMIDRLESTDYDARQMREMDEFVSFLKASS